MFPSDNDKENRNRIWLSYFNHNYLTSYRQFLIEQERSLLEGYLTYSEKYVSSSNEVNESFNTFREIVAAWLFYIGLKWNNFIEKWTLCQQYYDKPNRTFLREDKDLFMPSNLIINQEKWVLLVQTELQQISKLVSVSIGIVFRKMIHKWEEHSITPQYHTIISMILNFMVQKENWIKYKAFKLLFRKEKNKLILLGLK